MQDHHRERRASARKFLAAVTNDPAAVPPVGTRVLQVQYDTKYDPMADITFEDGRTLSVHLHMTSESPGDSDTAAWQECELKKLEDSETAKRIAAKFLGDPSPPKSDPRVAPEEVEFEGKLKIEIENSPGATVVVKVPNPARVAQRHLEAGKIQDWMQWMAQPIKVILRHHKEFVYGPVDDAMDAVIKEIAPILVKQIGSVEINEDVEDFERGAIKGKWDSDQGLLADPDARMHDDWVEGYQWGYDHADEFRGALPGSVHKKVVDEAAADFRKRVTEEVVKKLLKKAWHAVSPATTIKAIIQAVKKHGWKLGIGFALFELSEHFLIPSLLTALTGKPEMMGLATLPIGEVVYAIAFRILGRTPKELEKPAETGHIDWYEEHYGPVKIACLRG